MCVSRNGISNCLECTKGVYTDAIETCTLCAPNFLNNGDACVACAVVRITKM